MEETTRVVAPTRAPIEARCDDRTARRLASAALRWNLTRGTGGPLVLGTSFAMGVVLGFGVHSALWGTLVAVANLLVQLGSASLRTRHSFRKLALPGQLFVTRYDDQGRLVLTTPIGTSVLSPGSVDRVERRDGIIYLRTVPGRRWVLLPGQLLTEGDTAHLLDRRRLPVASVLQTAGPSARLGAPQAPGERTTSPSNDLDLIHVVDAQARRDLQVAVVAHRLRSRNGKLLLAVQMFVAACAILSGGWVGFSMLALSVVLLVVEVVRPVLAVGRSRPLGQLLRAAVTPTHLVVDEGDSESRLPWSSIRSCTVTRRAVVLVLRQGVILPLPRALFPQTELAQLQRLVAEHGQS